MDRTLINLVWYKIILLNQDRVRTEVSWIYKGYRFPFRFLAIRIERKETKKNKSCVSCQQNKITCTVRSRSLLITISSLYLYCNSARVCSVEESNYCKTFLTRKTFTNLCRNRQSFVLTVPSNKISVLMKVQL